MANKHIVRERNIGGEETEKKVMEGPRGDVVSEIMADIVPWRKLRDDTFMALWDEWYAKWRGFWRPQDKNTKSERSRLISPLTAMAVDLTVAEIVESVLGREYFVDLPDNVGDQEREDMEAARVQLCEDLRNEDFELTFPMAALNGALYGTGLMKIQILTKQKKVPTVGQDGKVTVATKEVVHIKPVAVEPGQFVPDPGATDIDEMKGCAHEFPLPLHIIEQRKMDGVYYKDVEVGAFENWNNGSNRGDTEAGDRKRKGDVAMITEYYGLIPTRMFLQATADATGQIVPAEVLEGVPAGQMTEVIATIANETSLLRVIENPNITGERLFVGYQHEAVPGRFWGRGVSEKASNVQRAMDAEMRARIDSLAWNNNPMFAGDLTRLPPGANLNAWPGKFWGTRGNPNEVIREFKISGPDAAGFQHMADLERMGQQATGALDSIMSLRSGVRDETATGSALSAAGFIKRSKRTMRNIETFLHKLVKRTLHLKMVFETEKYKADYDFQVKGTLGMMAREIEQQHLTTILQTLGADSPYSGLLLKAIVEQSSIGVREGVVKGIEAQMNKQPTPEEQMAAKAQLLIPVFEVEKLQAEIAKLRSEAGLKGAETAQVQQETQMGPIDAQVKIIGAANDLEETRNQVRQLDIQEKKLEVDKMKVRAQSKNKSKK